MRYYVILFIKEFLIYRVARSEEHAAELTAYDEDQPDVIPVGYFGSDDWSMKWTVEDEFRAKVSAGVLELIQYIRHKLTTNENRLRASFDARPQSGGYRGGSAN